VFAITVFPAAAETPGGGFVDAAGVEVLGVDAVVLGVDVVVLGVDAVVLEVDAVVLGVDAVVLGVDALVLGADAVVLGVDELLLEPPHAETRAAKAAAATSGRSLFLRIYSSPFSPHPPLHGRAPTGAVSR
jgi:hypothetical protein